MPHVFVSYSRQDRGKVATLVEGLRDAGVAVWIDQKSIPASTPWLAEIELGILAASLVVTVVSPAWDASSNCRTEVQLAQRHGKRIVELPVEAEPADWVQTVQEVLASLDDRAVLAAQLLGDAHCWHVAGRPRSHLPHGRLLRRFRSVRKDVDDEIVDRYLRSGVRAALWRQTVFGMLSLALLGTFLGWRFADGIQAVYPRRVTEEVEPLREAGMAAATVRTDAYQGLRAAIEAVRARPTTVPSLTALASALDANLPVSVVNPGGRAPRPAAALPDGGSVTEAGSTASLARAGVSVQIRNADASGALTLPVTGSVTALAWSPGGGMLAVADDGGIAIWNARTGLRVTVLRGLEGRVDQISWRDAATVLGRAGALEASWIVSPASVMRAGHEWYLGLEPDRDGRRLLAASRDGSVLLVGPDRATARIAIPGADQALGAAWTSDGWLVLGLQDGKPFTVVVSATGVVGERIELPPDCDARSIGRAYAWSAVVACTRAQQVVIVDVAKREARVLPTPVNPSAAIVDSAGALLVFGWNSELVQLQEDGAFKLIGGWQLGCTEGSSVIAASADRIKLLATGAQADRGCTRWRVDPTNRAATQVVLPPAETLRLARAAAWSPDGKWLVLGFAQGELWMFDAERGISRGVVNLAGSEIRGVAFAMEGSSVVAATRDGQLLRVPLDVYLASESDRLAEAEKRLAIGRDAGLLDE